MAHNIGESHEGIAQVGKKRQTINGKETTGMLKNQVLAKKKYTVGVKTCRKKQKETRDRRDARINFTEAHSRKLEYH